MKKKINRKERKHANKRLLLNLLKTGVVLSAALIAPGTIKLFREDYCNSPWDDYYPSSVERETIKLWRRGYVEISESKGQTEVKLTNKGKQEILRFNFEDLEIKKPNSWDRKWRMIIFDIPNEEKKKRDLLRDKLKGLGFFPMQESVFVYPYPCEREVKFLREVLQIPHYVKIIIVDRIENDEELRKVFSLR